MGTPDLSGTIVVLMHPRTGSSLVMQTLRLLGVAIVGDAMRTAFPADANPKGFFEDLDVLRDGLTAAPLRDDPTLLRGRAVKIALSPLVRRGTAEWDEFARQQVRLLLPIRTPAETFASRRAVLLKDRPGSESALKLFRSSALNYLVDAAFLAARWSRHASPGPAPVAVDYRLALEDPASYVDRLSRAAGLSPAAAQRTAAAANIDRALYRHQENADGGASTKGVEPLVIIHEILRAGDPAMWRRLHDSLPRWLASAWEDPTPSGPPAA